MSKLDKKIVISATILGAVSIALGAFGAHGLKELVNEQSLTSFNTGVRYQMYHTIIILVLGLSTMISQKTKKQTFNLVLIGILLFSGSIYLLSLQDLLSLNITSIAFLTPIGGLFFIIGWLRLGYGVYKLKRE